MQEEQAFDLVVVGSGAAGLTAAVVAAHHGLSVLVLEKAARFGGTTARSGAVAWIPNNPHMAPAGLPDSPEQADQYLRDLMGNYLRLLAPWPGHDPHDGSAWSGSLR